MVVVSGGRRRRWRGFSHVFLFLLSIFFLAAFFLYFSSFFFRPGRRLQSFAAPASLRGVTDN